MKEVLNKEDVIFHMYKDSIVGVKTFTTMCKKKYKIEDPYQIYVRITNYQIEKYGKQIVNEDLETTDSAREKCIKASAREHSSRNYYKKTNRRGKI